MEVIGMLPRTAGTITGIGPPYKLWYKVRKEAGCPDLRFHDLRHSFASAALAQGLTLEQIGELLGHASTQTTKRYAHLIESTAHAAAARTATAVLADMGRERA
jgi:integrase